MAVGFLPSSRGKTKGAPAQLRHLAIRGVQKGLLLCFPFLQGYVVVSSMYMSSAVLAHPPNFSSGSQKDIYCGGHSCV